MKAKTNVTVQDQDGNSSKPLLCEVITLKVMDIWHPFIENSQRWVFSNEFESTTEFINWVLQHQKDLSGVVRG